MAPIIQVSSINSNFEKESRYNNLLNPVRDVIKNWEVNIADQLEEFLSELEGIAISFSNGAPSLNFAMAGLLIQGSTTVYCKKVEYLCTLCQQIRHIFNDKRKRKKSESDVSKEKEVVYHCVSDEFVSLDNLKEQKGLELIEDDSDSECFKRVSILPLTPIVLIPLDDREKGHTMLLNVNGEVFGHKKDYHLNICHVDSSGALLLPISHSDVMSEFIRRDAYDCLGSSGAFLLPTSPSEVVRESIAEEIMPTVETEPDDDDNCNEYSPPSPVALEQSICCNDKVEVNHSERRRSSRLAFKEQVKLEKQKNLWKSSEFNKALIKPLKKKKAKKTGHSVKHKVTKCTKGNSSVNPTSSSEEFCSKAFYSHSSKFPKNSLKTPEISFFENVFWEQSKKENELLKVCQRQGSDFDENQQEEDDEDILNCNDTITADSDDDFLNDSLLECREEVPGESPCDQINDQDQIPVVPTYEELARKNIELYLESLARYCLTTDLSKKVNQWEEKMRPILEDERKREIFDIHVYESRLMDNFSTNNRKQSLSFSHACNEKPKWEVCRYFLASLQLANSYNVKIGGSEESENNEDFELTLLSRKKQFGDMYNTTEEPHGSCE